MVTVVISALAATAVPTAPDVRPRRLIGRTLSHIRRDQLFSLTRSKHQLLSQIGIVSPHGGISAIAVRVTYTTDKQPLRTGVP